MKTLLILGAWLTLFGFAWLMANALESPRSRPYVPERSQEDEDKWPEDWMNFV